MLFRSRAAAAHWLRRRALLALGLLTLAPGVALCHTVLDPEVAQNLLNEVARYQTASHSDAAREARAEAWFNLGSRVQALVGLLNQDLNAHGASDPLAQEVVKRLERSEVKLIWSEERRHYSYDLEAFRQYQKLAPTGPRAAESRFQLLSAAFYATLDLDPSKLAVNDIPAVINAVAEEERFLKAYANDARAKEVRFYLGVDCYRLSLHVRDAAQAHNYGQRARQALEMVAARYPGSIEARAAGALLEAHYDSARR
jgi:hypothetical protein